MNNIPNSELKWVKYYDKSGNLRYVVTTKKKSREYYYLYEYIDEKYVKIGRSKTPIDLERKIVL